MNLFYRVMIRRSTLDWFELMNHMSNNISNNNGWTSGNIGNIVNNGGSRCSAILCWVQIWAALRWKLQNSVAGLLTRGYARMEDMVLSKCWVMSSRILSVFGWGSVHSDKNILNTCIQVFRLVYHLMKLKDQDSFNLDLRWI